MTSQKEIDRRYTNIRAAMDAEKVDALIVCGNQYAGFEGAVRYASGFEIVHRYVYVLIPLAGDPTLVFPCEARWIGDKKAPWVRSSEPRTGKLARLAGSETRKHPGSAKKFGLRFPAN